MIHKAINATPMVIDFIFLSLSCYQSCCCTFRASDWLIFSTNQENVRPYTALAKASRADIACSKLSGVTICNVQMYAQDTFYLKNNNKQETANYVEREQDGCHLLSFGSEFLVSECLSQGGTINTEQLENKNTSVICNAFFCI